MQHFRTTRTAITLAMASVLLVGSHIYAATWQREGGYALFDAKVAKALSLTDQQQERLADAAKVNATEHQKMRDFMARARFRSQEAMEHFIEGYRKPANERLLKALNKEQQVTLKSLLGKLLSTKNTD